MFSSEFMYSPPSTVYFLNMTKFAQSHPLVVFTDPGELDLTPAIEYLHLEGWRTLVASNSDPNTIISVAQDAAALVVGYAQITASLLDALPYLKVIATMSAGYDQIDLAAAKERGLTIFNLPDAATEEVATHALAMALCLARQLPRSDFLVRNGKWTDSLIPIGRRLSTLKVGVIGLGRIGARFAELAKPLFGEVIVTDPALVSKRLPTGAKMMDLDDLLRSADIISLHSSWQPNHGPLLTHRSFEIIREGAIVINTSRGAAIDMDALVKGLESGKISGAGLDVFPEEPLPSDAPILWYHNVILSPHSAYLSPHSRIDYVLKPAKLVVAWTEGTVTQTPLVSS